MLILSYLCIINAHLGAVLYGEVWSILYLMLMYFFKDWFMLMFSFATKWKEYDI